MLAELAIVAFVLLGVGIPHAFPLERVAPLYAAALWGSALLLRAVVAAGGAVFLFVYLPGTGVFDAVARWCLHQVMPLLATHLGLSGHPVAHAAIVLPALALAASVMWLLVGLARAWLVVRRDLGAAVGEGPDGSTVIDQAEVLIALTAFGRPRIVVSVAAPAGRCRRAVPPPDAESCAAILRDVGVKRRQTRISRARRVGLRFPGAVPAVPPWSVPVVLLSPVDGPTGW